VSVIKSECLGNSEIEYERALYHLLSRGDRREDIFWDNADRRSFTNWWGVDAYCVIGPAD